MSEHIYVLRLERGKWYVGKTKNIEKRLLSHFGGSGSRWTSMYEPLDVVEVLNADKFDEDKVVKKYMARHGMENVRGDSYCLPTLKQWQKAALSNELLSSSGACFECGKQGHFASRCPRKGGSAYLQNARASRGHQKDAAVCDRCGRVGHYINTCYAKTDLRGNTLYRDSPTLVSFNSATESDETTDDYESSVYSIYSSDEDCIMML